MPWPPLSLIKRLVLGTPLQPAQMDSNLTDIETAVNAINAALSVVLDPLGNLKPNSVSTAALQDRCVTLRKLAFLSSFWALDTGAVNAIGISFTPACTAYAPGQVFWVKVAATNTGGTTLAVDALAPVSVQKFTSLGMGPLAGGELIANGEYIFVYDGTQFVLLNPTPGIATSHGIPVLFSPVTVATLAAATAGWVTNYDITATVPAGSNGIILAADAVMESNDPGGSDWTVNVRPDSLGASQKLLYCHAGTMSSSGNYAQSIYAFSSAAVGPILRHFDYQAILSGSIVSLTSHIYLVGYIT